MSTLRAVETFDFLLKHDNAKKKRRKVIRVVVIIVVILILLIGSAVLLKSFVIDKNSNDSTGPADKPITCAWGKKQKPRIYESWFHEFKVLQSVFFS